MRNEPRIVAIKYYIKAKHVKTFKEEGACLALKYEG